MAPDFMANFSDGSEFYLSSEYTKGEYILLNFTNTGCGYCYVFYPHLKNVQRKYGAKIMVVCIYGGTERGEPQVPENWDKMARVMYGKSYQKAENAALPSLWQADFLNETYNLPSKDGWPNSMLINSQGVIVGRVPRGRGVANDKKLHKLLEYHID